MEFMRSGSNDPATTRRRLLGALGVASGAGLPAVSGATPAAASQPAGSWPQFQYDDANTGHAPNNRGPAAAVGTRFAVDVGQGTATAPAVTERFVFVVDDQEGVLRALDRVDGAERWTASADLSGAWPAVDGDAVYLPGRAVTALAAADGTERWTASMDGTAHGVARVGSTVVAAGSSGVTALSADTGTRQWHVDSVSTWREPPAAAGEDVFAVDSNSGAVVSLNRGGGGRQWIRRFEGPVPGTPTVVDGLVIVPGAAAVHAFDRSTGVSAWEADEALEATVAAADGLAYGVTGDELVALSVEDGSEQWRRSVPPTTNPPVVAGGVLYLAGDEGDVLAVDAATGSVSWRASVDAEFRTAFAVAGGELYAGTRDGALHALAAGAGSPAGTPTGTPTASPTGAATATPGSADGGTEGGSADGGVLPLLGLVGLLVAVLARGRAALGGDD